MRPKVVVGLLLASTLFPPAAHSFCGFYVSSGNAKLFNHASQVVLARDQDHTVLTMSNDFKGEPKDFAIVVPVPVVLKKDQVHVGEKAMIDHIDAYSAPRLVEYFDEDPCEVREAMKMSERAPTLSMSADEAVQSGRALGVTIEARYTVGEYDILILSAKESHGLETWLTQNHYRIPPGASRVLGAYIRQGLKFFVAKVNLKEKQQLGFSYLRPIQVAYDSPRFMLPIRLGMANADGAQELFVYALTRKGRVETTNYRNVRIPSDMDLPVYIKDDFQSFYRAMFTEQVRRNDMSVVFTEYAWNMSWCDPCASEPLSNDELRQLGAFWVDGAAGQPSQVFITRLHVRYDRAHFPEDLVFQETADQETFQGRYVLRHEWTGKADCPEAKRYRATLPERHRKEAEALASLTGWDLAKIQDRMSLGQVDVAQPEAQQSWWQRMWKKK